MELVVLLFLFLIMLSSYIKNTESNKDSGNADASSKDIDIEAIIRKHGVIIPNTPDVDMYEDILTPPRTIWREGKSVWYDSHEKHNQLLTGRGDRHGRTPRGKTLHDKRQRGSYSLAMLAQDEAYQQWFDESL